MSLANWVRKVRLVLGIGMSDTKRMKRIGLSGLPWGRPKLSLIRLVAPPRRLIKA